MKTMTNISRTRAASRVALYVAALALAPFVASCSMLVDSPPSEKPQVMNVKQYYAKLETPKTLYHYQTSYARSGGAPTANTLEMEMYGPAPYDYQGMPTFGCDWTFQSGKTTKWYYALAQDSAVDLGDATFNEHWTDLKAPLAAGKSWSFTRVSGEVITAKITQFGVQVKVNGRTFDDVIAVEYTGDRGTASVRWFANGIGMIFAHTQNADGSVSEERFVDMGIEN